MARRSAPKRQKKAPARGQPGTAKKVKGHTRGPRGPNTGKSPVYVKSYRRRAPRRAK